MTDAATCCTSAASSAASNFTGKERDTESGNDYFEAPGAPPFERILLEGWESRHSDSLGKTYGRGCGFPPFTQRT
jgi:hypothetical protein